MKGKITKTDQGWMVSRCVGDGVKEVWEERIPLHPDDVKQINRDAQVFDNIEARIAAYPEVEFEIVDYGQKCRECGETVERGRSCTKGCFMKSGNFVQTDRVEYAKLVNH